MGARTTAKNQVRYLSVSAVARRPRQARALNAESEGKFPKTLDQTDASARSDSLLVPASHGLGRSLRAQNSCPETSVPSVSPVPSCCSRLHSHGYGSYGPHGTHGHGVLGLAGREPRVTPDVSHLVHPPSASLLHSATLHSPPTSLMLHQPGGALASGHSPLGMLESSPGLSTVEALQHKLQASEEVISPSQLLCECLTPLMFTKINVTVKNFSGGILVIELCLILILDD